MSQDISESDLLQLNHRPTWRQVTKHRLGLFPRAGSPLILAVTLILGASLSVLTNEIYSTQPFPVSWSSLNSLIRSGDFCLALTSPPGRQQAPFHTAVLLTVTGRSRGLRCLSCRQKAKSTERSRWKNELSAYIHNRTREEEMNRASHPRQGQTEPQMLQVLPPEPSKNSVHDPTGITTY